MQKYQPKIIEPKWQQKWDQTGLYKTDLTTQKDNYYVLVELSYPSGDLHIGHWFTYGFGDILARFKRMQGYNTFFPNGYDAFGLPAENAAIQRGIHPRDWTLSNIERMTQQFKLMGASFDWDSLTISCLPEYFKWNQWIFLKMFEKGLAYRGKVLSNWCPKDETVLANENVDNGRCWKCGTEVIQKEVEQWFFKITDYADRLIWQEPPQADWPKALIDAQNKWIGKSQGTLVKFDEIEVFTTRPDTIFGVSFLVVSPEHPLLGKLVSPGNKKEVESYIAKAQKKTELERKENKDKSGVSTGSTVKNPLSGEDVPVWVADYVLSGYGTGAVMGVPAHDQRDYQFAKKFNLPIKTVIEPITGEKKDDEEFRRSIVAVVSNPKTKKILSINWGPKLGGNLLIGGGLEENEDLIEAAIREIKEETGYKNLKFIEQSEKIHHHYFAASKNVQREIEATGLLFELENEVQDEVSLEKNEKDKFMVEWLSEEELESKIKDPLHKYIFEKMVKHSTYEGEGVLVNSNDYNGLPSAEAREKITKYLEDQKLGLAKTIYHLHDWSISRQRYWGTPIPIVHCPKCGFVPLPESELPLELPYEVDYQPKGKSPLASNEEWINTKCPKCGGQAQRDAETMDCYVDSSWYFFRYLDPHNDKKIFDSDIINRWMPLKIYNGGSEHTLGHALYSRFMTKFFKDLGLINFDEYALKRVHHGLILGPDGRKMSKSWGNVVNPDEEVKQYGADAIRTYLAFLGPYDIVAPWKPESVNGVYHFLQRVWALFDKVSDLEISTEDLFMMHKTINKVESDLEGFKYNTVIAALMEWLNYLSKKEKVAKDEYKTFLLLLAPFAPHITEELWSMLGGEYSIHTQKWPQFDQSKVKQDKIKIVVQVNSKVRDVLEVSSADGEDEQAVTQAGLKSPKVEKFLAGKKPQKVIFVASKLINFVI